MFVAITVFFFVSMFVMMCVTDDKITTWEDGYNKETTLYILGWFLWIIIGSIIIYWGFN